MKKFLWLGESNSRLQIEPSEVLSQIILLLRALRLMWPQTMVVRALEDVDVTVFGLEYYPKHPSSVRALHQLDSSLLILPILELRDE